MAMKSTPLPHVVVNLHSMSIESAFAKAGRQVEDVREVLLGRGRISFMFNKGDTRGAVTIETPHPENILTVWSNCFAPVSTKKAKGMGLDRVA